MRVITLNVNGVRSALNKGLAEAISNLNPDIILFQEVRAHSHQWEHSSIFQDYQVLLSPAEKAGYSGVAVLSKINLKNIITSSSILDLNDEGRLIVASIHENLKIINWYWPSGSSSEERHQIKIKYLDQIFLFLKTIECPFILGGDLNIAHTSKDIKNAKQNEKNSGFTIEERTWFSMLLKELNLIDTFRYLHPDENTYTWWSQRGKAYLNNVGWRIDYQLISEQLKPYLIKAEALREPKLSDHGIYLVDYDDEILKID